jgi:hypothetical protein
MEGGPMTTDESRARALEKIRKIAEREDRGSIAYKIRMTWILAILRAEEERKIIEETINAGNKAQP